MNNRFFLHGFLVAVVCFTMVQAGGGKVMLEKIIRSKTLITELTNKNASVLQEYDLFTQQLLQNHKAGFLSDKGLEMVLKALNFAAQKHVDQKRKDPAGTPYIIHPMGVARSIMELGRVYDLAIIMGALLHDTVEDTQTTFEEINFNFGPVIEGYVREVTDDKLLPKQTRKDLQIEHAPHASYGATLIKYADKLNNLQSIICHAPAGWSVQRKIEYFEWAKRVVDNLPAVNELFKNELDRVIKEFLNK